MQTIAPTQTIEIAKIRIDGGTQPRVMMDRAAVADYSESMKDGNELPPVVLYFDGKDYWLADGFHRRQAAESIGKKVIEAEVIEGSLRDAVLHSVGANANHGLRRTNDDKRQAVIKLLKDEEWKAWSDREIAKKCAVSQPLVSAIRKELSDNGFQMPESHKSIRNGTEYPQKAKKQRDEQSGLPEKKAGLLPAKPGEKIEQPTQKGDGKEDKPRDSMEHGHDKKPDEKTESGGTIIPTFPDDPFLNEIIVFINAKIQELSWEGERWAFLGILSSYLNNLVEAHISKSI
jgi:hypothetical protein